MRVTGLKDTVATLRKMDNETQKRLRKDMRAGIAATAREIANTVDSTPPLSGMGPNTRRGGNRVNGVTRWTGVRKAGVQFRTGGGKSRRILSMKFTGAQGGLGLIYAELAGSSRRPGRQFTKVYERNGIPGFQHAVRGQGAAFNEGIRKKTGINKRGGFFLYDAAIKRAGSIERQGRDSVNKYMKDANAAIRKARFGF